MYPVTVSIRRDLLQETSCPDLAELIDILWAHALPADGLEHIGRRITYETVDVVLFMKSATQENACQAALKVCRRMLSASPALADWKLIASDTMNSIISISKLKPGRGSVPLRTTRGDAAPAGRRSMRSRRNYEEVAL